MIKYKFINGSHQRDDENKRIGYWEEYYKDNSYWCGNYNNGKEEGYWLNVINGYIRTKTFYSKGIMFNDVAFDEEMTSYRTRRLLGRLMVITHIEEIY